MPRGYLKHKARSVGTKRARGGQSRHDPSTCGVRAWEIAKRRYRRKRASRLDRDFFQHMHLMDGCFDYDEEYDEEEYQGDWDYHDGYEEGENVAQSLADGTSGVKEHPQGTCNSIEATRSVADDSLSEEGHDTFDASVELIPFAKRDDVPEDQSYSFCSVASFSLCEASTTNDSFSFVDVDDEIASSNSSLWDFVAETLSPASEKEAATPRHPATTIDASQPHMDIVSVFSEPSHCAPAAHTPLRLAAARRCAICLQNKPLRAMMHKCNPHPSACMDCLRTHYFEHQIKDTSNFPLQCFWPGCHRAVRDVQIRRLARNGREMELYYRQASLAREGRRVAKRLLLERALFESLQERRVQNFKVRDACQSCGRLQTVHPVRDGGVFRCGQCPGATHRIQIITEDEIRSIVHALGEWLVFCPQCERLIVKDGGCDHMTCVCEHEFSFQGAQVELKKHHHGGPVLL